MYQNIKDGLSKIYVMFVSIGWGYTVAERLKRAELKQGSFGLHEAPRPLTMLRFLCVWI